MDYADGTDTEPRGVRPGVNKLIQTDDTTVVAFAFDVGGELREHTAAHPILITCARGAVEFDAEGQTRRIAPGIVLRLDARVPHAVRATEPALMMLTMLHNQPPAELPAPVTEGLQP